MLITNHVLSGALVGLLTPQPLAAAGAGFLSHFVLDVTPHFGVDDTHLMRVAVPDGLVGLGTLALISATAPRQHRVAVMAAMFGACLPDMDKPARQFFGRSPFPGWFDRLHARIQPESSSFFPIEVIAASAFAAGVVRRFDHERRRGRARP